MFLSARYALDVQPIDGPRVGIGIYHSRIESAVFILLFSLDSNTVPGIDSCL